MEAALKAYEATQALRTAALGGWPGPIAGEKCSRCNGAIPWDPSAPARWSQHVRDGKPVCSLTCRVAGLVPCPASPVDCTPTCVLCRGSGWVEELT